VTSLVPDPAGVPPQTARLVNPANGLTLLRLLLVPVFAALLLHDQGTDMPWRIAATVAFGVATITDRIDGQVARSRGLVTEFGKLADPIADKALTGTALVGLSALGLLWWWVTAVILGREIGVTLLRFWVIRHGVIPASRGGKLKTFVQNCAIGLYVMPLPHAAWPLNASVMALALALTLITGADYVARAVRLRSAGRARRAIPRQPGPIHQAAPTPVRELPAPVRQVPAPVREVPTPVREVPAVGGDPAVEPPPAPAIRPVGDGPAAGGTGLRAAAPGEP
jgi:CDP-diacylglycerol---glycerol-3-phosphate 3-phosphatidyltransferase